MRHTHLVSAAVLACCIMLAGCGKKSGVDTSALEKNFASAQAPIKAEVTKAVEAVKAERYSEAMTSLGALTANPALTAEQKTAITDIAAQLGAAVAEQAKAKLTEAQKKLGGK